MRGRKNAKGSSKVKGPVLSEEEQLEAMYQIQQQKLDQLRRAMQVCISIVICEQISCFFSLEGFSLCVCSAVRVLVLDFSVTNWYFLSWKCILRCAPSVDFVCSVCFVSLFFFSSIG